MYAVLGEDRSDVDTLKELIHRITGDRSILIRTKGYSGCGDLLRKGAKQLKLFKDLGCTKFIVCYDSDGECPNLRKQVVLERIISPAKVDGIFCALVPIQEIEAWVLADLSAVAQVIPSFKSAKPIHHPETIKNPKEHLEKLSRKFKRPKYSHATHNSVIAKYIDLEILERKCPSFIPLVDIIKNSKSNI